MNSVVAIPQHSVAPRPQLAEALGAIKGLVLESVALPALCLQINPNQAAECRSET